MATTGSGRGPIKVGSGYIDVFPKINQKQLREAKAQLEKQMGASGKKAGKALSEGISSQLATIPKKVAQASQKAQKELQKGAQDSKKVLKRIEQEITRDYGKEAGKRFREAAELEKKKQKLLEGTSAETRRALQATLREEQQAARTSSRSWETAERERLRMLQERKKAAEKAARDEVAAQRRAQQQIRDEYRRTLTETRTARLADLRSQLDGQRDQAATLRNNLRDYRRQMDDHTRSVGRGIAGLQRGWRRQGEAIERLGTNITETGRLVTTHLLAPLTAVSGALTTIGVQSADMRILGQMGLTAAGVSKKTSADQMRNIQQYAIDTPFSIDTMHEYQMKLIRSIAGNDNSWYKKDTRTEAANRAATKTTDIIMSVGDTMARAGNLDPEMFKRAMYAVDRIMDLDKAPTRNINQLVQSTGIPAGELARMFGFENAGAFWKKVGTPVAKGGGISGQDMVNNLLQFWDPNYFVMGKDGKPKIDPKTGQPIMNPKAHSTAGGSKGYGERMTSATITGRVSQIKERAQYELGSLFAKENKKTGEYEYTGLGQSIMGKATGKDKNGNVQYEGGLLQQIQQLGGDQKSNVVTLLKTFFDAIGTFVEQLQWFSDWLNAHPQVKEVFANLLKMAATALPFIIAIGLATKTLGKLNKIFASALTPLAGAFKGIRGAVRTGRQVGSGVRAGLQGGDMEDRRNRMSQAYRDRRTQLRGGDTRGPIARTRDRATGGDANLNRLRGQIRDTEDAIRRTEDSVTDLQRQIREVNSVSIRQLVDQFAGTTGSGSLQGAAQNAGSQVNNATTQVTQLNRQGLGAVSGEVTGLHDKVKDLVQEVKNASGAVEKLDGKKLTAFKVTVDSAHGTVEDLKNKIDQTASSTGRLNAKKLSSLRKEFSATTTTAGKTESKIKDVRSRVATLNGAGLASIIKKFNSLDSAANEVYKRVGTTNSGVNGRITTLNGRSLKTITDRVKKLGDQLKDTGDKANTLNNKLNDISKHAPGGGGGGGKDSPPKKRRRALGGVLPGYTPGQDVHKFVSPTAGILELSGGESVMRPEWTAAVGPGFVNEMNLIARTKGVHGIRQAMKFAGGGIIDKLGLGGLIEAARSSNIGPDVRAAAQTMTMDSSSRALGGGVQSGVVGSGTAGSKFIGSDIADRLDTMRKFFTNDAWEALKKLPIPDGISQVVGIIGGAIAPVAGDYWWDDVWKGQGNILERGNAFLGDLFSTKTLKSVISNLFGGVWDSAKGLFNGAKALITDPIGTVKDTIGGLWEMTRQQYDGVIDTVKGLREIWQNPKDYASQVIRDIYSTAKESLPNLEGLFDFSGEGLSSKKPDVSGLLDSQLSAPGAGSSVTRWTPQVKMALAQLGLPASALDLVLHRIQVESGGNPKAINNWDINAKNGVPSQGLMQTIPPTFNSYAGPYRSRGITDPMANIYAGLNYAVHRYGSGWMKALSGNKGYAKGTDGAAPGWAWVGEQGPELVKFKGGETVLNARDSLAASGNVKRGYASGTTNSGLYKATIGSVSQLNTAIGKMRDLISKAFSAELISKGRFGSLSKWLEKENKALTKAANKRADIAKKIKEANDRLTNLRKERDEMASNLSGQVSGGTPLTAAFNGGGGVTATSALAGLKDRLKAINDFKKNLAALTKKGYSKEIINEVASAGLEQGNEMAKALLSASSSQVKDITKTYSDVFKASDSLGKSVAGQYYKAGEDSAKAMIAGLKSQEKALLKSISTTVNKVIAKLRKDLGIGKSEAVRSDIASLLTWLTGASQPSKPSKSSSSKKKTKKKKKGYWTGTLSASPGLALVGERGPELVNFSGGERVYNSRETEALMAGSRPVYLTINEAKHETTPQAVLRGLQWVDSMYGNRL
jgi:SLT domain-containing protein